MDHHAPDHGCVRAPLDAHGVRGVHIAVQTVRATLWSKSMLKHMLLDHLEHKHVHAVRDRASVNLAET
jgi:S-ribosylhomocysteine lyase LuxS involved in autoinducer biosynthesis